MQSLNRQNASLMKCIIKMRLVLVAIGFDQHLETVNPMIPPRFPALKAWGNPTSSFHEFRNLETVGLMIPPRFLACIRILVETLQVCFFFLVFRSTQEWKRASLLFFSCFQVNVIIIITLNVMKLRNTLKTST